MGGYDSNPGDGFGAFAMKRHSQLIRMIATDGNLSPEEIAEGPELAEAAKWEHVSVSLANRCPTWEEMCIIKSLFWDDDDVVLQFHPPKSDYVNQHPFCLHLWRYKGEIPRPPTITVGLRQPSLA
jgi:hypothetical protein